MTNEAFSNADGEMLIVPQEGSLTIRTELGIFKVLPNEIFVVPRGIRFAVSVTSSVRGYTTNLKFSATFARFLGHRFGCLTAGQSVTPQLLFSGPNGLAQPKHFLTCTAAYEQLECAEFKILNKYQGNLFEAVQVYLFCGTLTEAFLLRRGRLAWKLCPVQVRPGQIHGD